MSHINRFVTARHTICLLLLLFLLSLLAGCSQAPGSSTINSAPGIEDRFNAVTIPSSQVVNVTASCTDSEQMVSGGWSITTSAGDSKKYPIAASYPSGPRSWTVTFTNKARGNILGTTHVECLINKNATPSIVSKSLTDPNGSLVTVNCPSGTTVSGGGYQLTAPTPRTILAYAEDVRSSQPSTTTSWSVSIFRLLNQLQSAQEGVRAYAVCTHSITTSVGPSSTVTASAAADTTPTEGTGNVTCENGQVPVGAGYDKTNGGGDGALPLTLFFPDYGATPAQWNAIILGLPGQNIDSPASVEGGTVRITPLCASVS